MGHNYIGMFSWCFESSEHTNQHVIPFYRKLKTRRLLVTQSGKVNKLRWLALMLQTNKKKSKQLFPAPNSSVARVELFIRTFKKNLENYAWNRFQNRGCS